MNFWMGVVVGVVIGGGVMLFLARTFMRREEDQSLRQYGAASTLYQALRPFADETAFTLVPGNQACTVDAFALTNAKAAMDHAARVCGWSGE